MSESSLFDKDSEQGIQRTWHFDEATGRATIQTEQIVDHILEAAKVSRNNLDARAPFKDDVFNHVGRIPLTILYQAQESFRDPKTGQIDKQRLYRWKMDWLNENPAFKTRPGRL